MVSLDELPKKVQYVMIDSSTVNGTMNSFSVDLTLSSNIHAEDINKVVGIRLVDYYFCSSTGSADANIPLFIDIQCEDIPKRGQMLDEGRGQIFSRIPMRFTNLSGGRNYYQDAFKGSFLQQNRYFNPINIKKLNFEINLERLNDIVPLIADSFYMVLEVTTIDHKEKPKDREVQILQALNLLNMKIDELNNNVVRIPTQKEEEERKSKKIPFGFLMIFITALLGGYLFFIRKSNAVVVQRV